MKAAESMAKVVLEAIVSGNPETARSSFFPETAFNELKAIAHPERYHKKLIKWYEADLKREHEKYKSQKLTFVAFKRGGCKWKEKNSEYNKIPYWSCYRSSFNARNTETGKEVVIKVKAMINWGADWFVTHLGPIPKN